MTMLYSLKMRAILFCLFFIPLISCTSLPLNNENALSPNALNMDTEKFVGQSVFLKGYVVLGTNSRCLYESKDRYKAMISDFENDFQAFQNDYNDDKITLLNPAIIWENRDALEGRTIVLKGNFVNNYDYANGNPVDLQACSRNALVLDEEHLKGILN